MKPTVSLFISGVSLWKWTSIILGSRLILLSWLWTIFSLHFSHVFSISSCLKFFKTQNWTELGSSGTWSDRKSPFSDIFEFSEQPSFEQVRTWTNSCSKFSLTGHFRGDSRPPDSWIFTAHSVWIVVYLKFFFYFLIILF